MTIRRRSYHDTVDEGSDSRQNTTCCYRNGESLLFMESLYDRVNNPRTESQPQPQISPLPASRIEVSGSMDLLVSIATAAALAWIAGAFAAA